MLFIYHDAISSWNGGDGYALSMTNDGIREDRDRLP